MLSSPCAYGRPSCPAQPLPGWSPGRGVEMLFHPARFQASGSVRSCIWPCSSHSRIAPVSRRRPMDCVASHRGMVDDSSAARALLVSKPSKVACPAALASSGSVIRRPNGADNLRCSDSIRNNCPVGPKIPELPRRKTRNYGCKCGRISCRSRPPGTEFLDAETGRQKPPPKRLSAHRDQSPRSKWPEIPGETPYFASYRNRAVREDWVVEVVGHKLKTHHPVIEPVSDSESGTEFFDAETEGPDPPFCIAETHAETRTNSKKPAVRGTNARITR